MVSGRHRVGALLAAAIGIALGGRASAQELPPIEDRDFALDLHTGAALGSVRIVGMGGTAVAAAEGSAGTLANPAAAAVRLTTSKGSWDWDFHLDALQAVGGSDLDNNGIEGTDGFGTSLETTGLAGMLHGWGLAFVGTSATATVSSASAAEPLEARTLAAKIAIARELLAQTWTVGAAVRIGQFELERAGAPLFSLSGAGLELGGLWRPPRTDWRVGASIALPITGRDVVVGGCDPADCEGYVLPARVAVPWQVAAGVAWRWAPTRWNQAVPWRFRDEPAILLAADVVVTGAVDGGAGLEAFGDQVLQRSGRTTSVSLRAGAEWEWLPGRLRLRAGSYWEPGRFDGVGGRLHGTFGAELSLFQFRLWSWDLRTRVSATGDVASRFANAGLSVGFWH